MPCPYLTTYTNSKILLQCHHDSQVRHFINTVAQMSMRISRRVAYRRRGAACCAPRAGQALPLQRCCIVIIRVPMRDRIYDKDFSVISSTAYFKETSNPDRGFIRGRFRQHPAGRSRSWAVPLLPQAAEHRPYRGYACCTPHKPLCTKQREDEDP